MASNAMGWPATQRGLASAWVTQSRYAIQPALPDPEATFEFFESGRSSSRIGLPIRRADTADGQSRDQAYRCPVVDFHTNAEILSTIPSANGRSGSE